MALKKCRECKNDVSDEAETCPTCGIKKPVKKTSRATWLILGLIVFGVVMVVAIPKSPNTSQAVVATPAPAKKITQADELQLMALKCIEVMKTRLQDPSSGQFPNAYTDFPTEFASLVKGDIYVIQFDFRAKNGFNALRSFKGECKWKKLKNGDFNPVSVKSTPN